MIWLQCYNNDDQNWTENTIMFALHDIKIIWLWREQDELRIWIRWNFISSLYVINTKQNTIYLFILAKYTLILESWETLSLQNNYLLVATVHQMTIWISKTPATHFFYFFYKYVGKHLVKFPFSPLHIFTLIYVFFLDILWKINQFLGDRLKCIIFVFSFLKVTFLIMLGGFFGCSFDLRDSLNLGLKV